MRPSSARLRRLSPTLLALLLAGSGLPAWPGHLVGQDTDSSPHSDVRLIPEVTSIRPGTPFTVAVRFELEPKWHNYWQNAGDSGLPTEIEWRLPPGFRAGSIQWPIPDRIVAYTLTDYGYSGQPTLLVEVTPPADLPVGGPVTLAARVDWLVCMDICLPAYQEVEVQVAVSSQPPRLDPSWAPVFVETRSQLPGRVEGWTLAAEVTESGYRLSVTPSAAGRRLPDSVYFFAAETSVLDHAATQANTREGEVLALALTRSPYATRPSAVLRGVLLDESGGAWDEDGRIRALEVEVPVAGAPPASEAAAQGTGAAVSPPVQERLTLLLALLFALLGGILLNLMPCVFPVLSLKILGAAGQAGGDRRRTRNQGLVFGLGVLLSFLALAGLLMALRAGGSQLGWGFQLQSPLFVAFMAALFFAIGLNLMGVFEVGLTLTRLGDKPGAPAGYRESLASGVLASVIATPCTAPFMGAALGFALTRPVHETFLVFGLLGLGMALPYVVLSLAPGLLDRLPRPGPWMETLRQFLAFPMFGTVIWLVWVFGMQAGVGGATYLLSALLLIAAAGWMVGRWHRTDLRSGLAARAVSVLALVLAIVFAVRGSAQEPPPLTIEEGWQPFLQEEVEQTLAEGRPAFVDFTAAWCLTCQVNERLVLNTEAIQEAFRSRNVALFKADWTRQDPHITAALEALGRNGVPVYVLYRGAPGSAPHLLPTLLTEDIVLRALEEVLAGG